MNQLQKPTETMTSSQFAEMTGREKKSINRKIRELFAAEIDGNIIAPSLDTRGYVDEYLLPETESIMLAAKLDNTYLRKIADFWKNRNNPTTTLEMLLVTVQKAVENERSIKELQVQQNETTAQVQALVEGEGYFTIIGYANLSGIPIPSTDASYFGKQASEVCREDGIRIGKATHPLYGKVNTYPKEVIESVFWPKGI